MARINTFSRAAKNYCHPPLPITAGVTTTVRIFGLVRIARWGSRRGLPIEFACRPDRLPYHSKNVGPHSSVPQLPSEDQPPEGPLGSSHRALGDDRRAWGVNPMPPGH